MEDGQSAEIELAKQRPVGQNGYMPSHSINFANSNYKQHDHNNANDRLPPAEIMLQVWDEMAGAKKDDLKWIVRSHAVNGETQGIIKESVKRCKENELLQVSPDCDAEVFEALSGTPNCKGIYPTLAYHQGTRNWRVTDLHIWDQSGSNFFIAMKIGRK
ncbi:hypothetical protein SI65_03757 [Aspergillus cristatus]|uniref:Uncharacterized protein n=1 Tax=Aspergillus cristatus TaxID=573508 RepID=A0A1E3BIC8_ASPCR|nr:hypothetical protein SI65_03757 [Aspergillus cristatus]